MCEKGEKDLKNKNECELFYAIFGHKIIICRDLQLASLNFLNRKYIIKKKTKLSY